MVDYCFHSKLSLVGIARVNASQEIFRAYPLPVTGFRTHVKFPVEMIGHYL